MSSSPGRQALTDWQKLCAPYDARNKTIHINHAYAIRRADIYSDLRETRSKRNHKNEVTKNEVTKYSTTKKDMQLDNKQQCMDSLRPFFVARKFSSHTGEVHQSECTSDFEGERRCQASGYDSSHSGIQTFSPRLEKVLTAAVWLQLLTFPPGWEKTWVSQVLGG